MPTRQQNSVPRWPTSAYILSSSAYSVPWGGGSGGEMFSGGTQYSCDESEENELSDEAERDNIITFNCTHNMVIDSRASKKGKYN